MNTKIILSALGLATLVASPAFAQKPVHRAVAPGAYASTVAPAYPAFGAPDARALSTDPDINVRSELRRDWPTSIGAN